MDDTKEDKSNKNFPQKKLPYFRIIFFITLLIFTIYISQIIERNYKAEKVLGAESKNNAKINVLDEINNKIQGIFSSSVKKAEKSVDDVMGAATQYAADTASKSAEAVKNSIFQSTVGTIVKQIDKLPQKQQEEIKKEMCK